MSDHVASGGKYTLAPDIVDSGPREWPCYLERPHWLKFVRIWELAPALPDEVHDTIRDVLALGRVDHVDAIIREYGVVGCWRPSTVIVRWLQIIGSQRMLARDVIAHSLWNTDHHQAIPRNDGIQIRFDNDLSTERVLRIEYHLTALTDQELRR